MNVHSVAFTETALLSTYPYARTNGAWYGFSVVSNVPIKVVVNPTGSTKRLAASTYRPRSGGSCRASSNQVMDRSNGEFVYLRGCSTGSAVLELHSKLTDKLLKKYTITVRR